MTDSDATQRDDGASAPEAAAPVRDTAEAPEASASPEESSPAPEAAASPGADAAAPGPDAEAGSPDATTEGGEAASPESSAQVTEAAPGGPEPAPAGESAPSEGGDAAPEGAQAGAEGAEGAEGAKKKKRRRRKKKKGAGAEGADAEAKPAAQVPFLKYFEGSGGKKHAFTAGEVVAGRVAKVADGAVSVDLFGKATAFVDVFEPHEIPVIVEEPAPAPAEAAAGAAEGSTAPQAELGAEGHPDEVDTLPEGEGPDAEAVAAAVRDTVPDAAPRDTVPEPAPAPPEPAPAPAPEAKAEAASAEATSPPADDGAPEAEAASAEAAPPQAASPDVEAASSEAEAEAVSPPAPASPPEPPPEPPAVGAIFRGRVGSVSESGHIAIVNRIVDRPAAKERLRAAQQEHRRVEGMVYGFNRGGFDVLMEGIRVFCPAAAMALEPIEDPHPYLGRKMEFSIAPTKGSGKSIIVSRRTILEKELRKKARERMKKLIVGERLDGTVTEVRDYGLIVDIGEGLDGLVHLSEVSWNRADKPSDVAKVGDRVEVEVIKITPASRKDRFGRVSLSMRRCQRDPWDLAAETLKEGAALKGKVVRTTDFGAFIELAPGVEGLLHISELGGKDLAHAKQVLDEGQEIDVAIERIDRGQRRISLSRLTEADLEAIASGEFDPSKAPKSLKPGSHVEVLVERVEHHGVFVQVAGVLGRRGRGYLPNRELGDAGDDRRRAFAPGTKIAVKIVGTDRSGQLRCSVKALQIDEERRAVKDYRKEAARQGFGTFGDLLKAKLERDGK